MSARRLGASFRDPSGVLFQRDGTLYRQVNASYREAYDMLLASGRYEGLVDEHLLIPHDEVGIELAASAEAYRVLLPERVAFISYPYSWCFSQLRDAALTTLPSRRSWLRFSTLLHIHLHARSLRRFAETSLQETSLQRPVRRTSMLGLIDNLESAIRRLTWAPAGTEWADYVDHHNYGAKGMEDKQRLVRKFLVELGPRTVWDLGANTGTFSRIAAELGAQVVAFDSDPAAVERAYLEVRASGEPRVLPLLMDLTNPSPDAGWACRERMSLVARGPADTVLALALVHHFASCRIRAR